MTFMQRIRAWAPPILEAPRDATDYLLYRINGNAEPIAQGSSLTIREHEIAALVVDNLITNVLAPGIYRLDREHLGELEAIFSWPLDYAGAIGADIYFVSSIPAKRQLWQSRPGEEITMDGSPYPFEAAGTIDFTISDSRRFLSSHIESGRHDDTAIRRALDRRLLFELRAMLTEPDCDVDALKANLRETARALRKRLVPVMSDQGISDFSIRIRRLQFETSAVHGESVNDSVPTAQNVTPLTPNLRHTLKHETKQDNLVASEDPGDLDALLDIERELEKMDAWSSIAQGYDPVDAGNAGTSAAENIKSEVKKPHLPASFQELGFFIAVGMEQRGPFDANEFEQAVEDGRVDESTLVWFRGLDDWKPAGEVPEISILIDALTS